MTALRDWIGRIIASAMWLRGDSRALARAGPGRRPSYRPYTFDDVPWVMLRNAPPADLAAEHARLIASLKQADVPVIASSNEGLLYSDKHAAARARPECSGLLDAGFELGNHTRWHSDLNAVGVRRFKT
jgi:hypothetical protein